MHWRDPAIILSLQPHGETSVIACLLTQNFGRQKGLIRGGRRLRQRGASEPGSRVEADWSARLSEHLGYLRLEPIDSVAAALLDDPLRLSCLMAALGLLDLVLPEREPHRQVFQRLDALISALAGDSGWAATHLELELALLSALGFGLDLSTCAVTEVAQDLAFVSPKTGRAVSRAAAKGFEERLLILPRGLGGIGRERYDPWTDLLDGLALTGWFLDRHVWGPAGVAEPQARARYRDRLGAINTTD